MGALVIFAAQILRLTLQKRSRAKAHLTFFGTQSS
jgi:hypothetical protein